MTDRTCDTCQKPIPENAPGGLCPPCLLKRGLRDDSDAASTGSPGPTADTAESPESTLGSELPGRYTTIEDSGQGGMGKVYLVRDAQLGRWWGNWDEALYLSLMTDALEATRRPAPEGLPELRRIENEVERLASRTHPMLAMFPAVGASFERAAALDTVISRARIRVALERYRKKHGAFPASLQDLVPQWLDAVPLHILSGKPFTYSPTPSGYGVDDPRVPVR